MASEIIRVDQKEVEEAVILTSHMTEKAALIYLQANGITVSVHHYRKTRKSILDLAQKHLIKSANSFKIDHMIALNQLDWIQQEILTVYKDAKTSGDKLKALTALKELMPFQAAYKDATKFVVTNTDDLQDNEKKKLE